MKRKITGAYSNTIWEAVERAVEEKYGENGRSVEPGIQRYFSLKLPLEMKPDFLEIKARLSLDTGENLSNVDVCQVIVEAAHRELVKRGRALNDYPE